MWIRLACSEAICSKMLFTGVCEKIFIGRVLTEVIKETSCSKKYILSRVDNLTRSLKKLKNRAFLTLLLTKTLRNI